MKRFLAVILVIIFTLIISSATVLATEPRWANIISITSNIAVSSDSYSTTIEGLAGTTKIKCTLVLYEKNWLGVEHEVSRTSDTYYGQIHEFVGQYDMSASRKYVLKTTATVTTNGVDETINYTHE